VEHWSRLRVIRRETLMRSFNFRIWFRFTNISLTPFFLNLFYLFHKWRHCFKRGGKRLYNDNAKSLVLKSVVWVVVIRNCLKYCDVIYGRPYSFSSNSTLPSQLIDLNHLRIFSSVSVFFGHLIQTQNKRDSYQEGCIMCWCQFLIFS
jgi:hypothetical protein